jgi:MSHA pilin protein MshC
MGTRIAPRASGFTLVELVMVIILIGVLSAVGIGLFAGRSAFSPLLATQQLSSATLLAQQAALAGNSSDTLTIRQTSDELLFSAASSQFSLQRSGATMAYSVGGDPFTTVPAGGVTIGFDDLGRVASPTARTSIDFRITGDSTFNLCLSSLGAVFEGSCP